MHALIQDGVVAQYPYTLEQLRTDNPQVSFPYTPSKELLEEFGVFGVLVTGQPPIAGPEVSEQTTPIFNAERNRWEQSWTVRNATAEEAQAQAESVRAERNQLLLSTDWTQVSDAPVNQFAWAAYRQQLRDLTAQVGFPYNVTWPAQPE